MAVCAHYQIPHEGVFLAEWSESDRQKAIAWHMLQARICPRCGTDPDKWNPDKGGHRHAYKAEIHICPGCEVQEREQERLDKNEAWKTQRGKSVVLRPNPRARGGGAGGGARRRRPRA